MNYELNAGAEGDYLEALVYYGIRRSQLVLDFEAAFQSLIRRICDSPRMYPIVSPPDVRRARMGRPFPHSVFYREVEGGILVVAVHHPSRDPDYWLDRI